MTEALKFDVTTVQGIPDPTTDSGELFLFEEAFGQNGRPFVFMVEDPPNKTRARHYHHEDVLYVYVKGEHHIEGEATYRAGDLRWTRKGHVYGPETTGPDGGAWWVVSYGDPVPVNVIDGEEAAESAASQAVAEPDQLPHFGRPYDWKRIDHAVLTTGGAIVEGLLAEDELKPLNEEIDTYLGRNAEAAGPASGSRIYDFFLGHKTLRLHGLAAKVPSSSELMARLELIEWAERMMSPGASSVLLNAGELIQIQPGEPAQVLHRDSDSWPVPIGEHPVIVNAIVALDPCTLQNGATYIVPESWQWDPNRAPKSDEFARAVMQPGDALLFRGDLVHGGGENKSDARRRVLSISYCAGWLRPVENSFLNLSPTTVSTLPEKLQAILGYAAHDATANRGGMVGLYENGDPARALPGAS